jgi:TonB family protein
LEEGGHLLGLLHTIGLKSVRKDRNMFRRCFPILCLLLICLPAKLSRGQEASNQVERKILKQTMPRYPEIARRMNLAGTVKVMAVVAPDGKVKSVEPMGGSPVLIQAAQDAVSQWKFAPANGESRQVVELHFNPQDQ